MGTTFTIDVDGKQYLVTAKHLVASVADGAEATINIRGRTEWHPFPVTVLKAPDPIDIAVLVPKTQVTVSYDLPANLAGTAVGADAYFVGFPFGLEHAITYPTLGGVFGIIKRATIAQLEWIPDLKIQRIWLDGINNEGFSGSPVVFRGPTNLGNNWKVAAVISGYEPQISPVYDRTEIAEADITPADREQNLVARDGDKVYRLKDTGRVVRSNTGLALAWDINSALELIRKHPIGPPVSDKFSEFQIGY
jgi:S1-C subfamily serine protease